MPLVIRSLSVNKRRRYIALQQEQAFVRSVLQRRVTPEVAQFMADAAERSRRASSADFLNRFRSTSTV